MQGPNYSLLPITMIAAGAVAAGRFVDYLGAQASAKGNTLGVSFQRAENGEAFTVEAEGVMTMAAGGTVTAGAAVETNAEGLPVDRTDGVIVGRALTGGIAGERVQIRLLQNG